MTVSKYAAISVNRSPLEETLCRMAKITFRRLSAASTTIETLSMVFSLTISDRNIAPSATRNTLVIRSGKRAKQLNVLVSLDALGTAANLKLGARITPL